MVNETCTFTGKNSVQFNRASCEKHLNIRFLNLSGMPKIHRVVTLDICTQYRYVM